MARQREKNEAMRRLVLERQRQAQRVLDYSSAMEQEMRWNRWGLTRKAQLMSENVKVKFQGELEARRREIIFQKDALR